MTLNLRPVARPPADPARHHAQLRVERGRRPLRRHRAMARRATGRAAAWRRACRPGADQVVARSIDGMTIGTPVATVMDGRDAMLVVGMNGVPLPLEHGFPVRMLTPGLYGYVGACKWLVDLEITTFAAYDPYWVKRGWAAQAPVKTASRIDRPVAFTKVKRGRGEGAGRRLGAAPRHQRGRGAGRRRRRGRPPRCRRYRRSTPGCSGRGRGRRRPGRHQLRVRATDKTGALQPGARVPTFPNGATGWHSLAVTVS